MSARDDNLEWAERFEADVVRMRAEGTLPGHNPESHHRAIDGLAKAAADLRALAAECDRMAELQRLAEAGNTSAARERTRIWAEQFEADAERLRRDGPRRGMHPSWHQVAIEAAEAQAADLRKQLEEEVP